MKKNILLIVLLGMGILFSCTGNEPPTKKNKVPKAPEKEAVTKSEETSDMKPAEPTVPPEQLAKAKEIIASVSAKDIAAVDAKQKYKLVCSACHGFTGNLNVNGAKDLTKSTLPLAESVAQVYHGKGLMTPFKGLLSDAEIVAVSKYIEEELR